MKLVVATWNIHKGIGGVDRRYRIDRVIELLARYDPDVALLQEVADGLPRARHHEQVELLAESLGMHYAFAPEHRFAVGGYGNAVLSKWPISGVKHIDLTVGWRKKRGALQARTRIRGGRRSRTLVVHDLHLGLAGSERGTQLARFLRSEPFAGLHGRTPLIVGGDLNDLWGTLGKKYLLPAGFRRAGELVDTFPASLPVRPLDGLFVRGDLVAERVICPDDALARRASDHRPLIAELRVVGARGAASG